MKNKQTETKLKSVPGLARHSFGSLLCLGAVILICSSALAQNLFVSSDAAGNKALKSEAFLDKFATFGDEPGGGTPEDFAAAIKADSAKWGDVDSLQTLLGFEEVSYFVMFAWLGIAGPGPVSLDHFVLKALRKDRPPSAYGA